MIEEIKRVTIKDDIYLLKRINNRIIINANYQGISVLDLDFNIIKTIYVMKNFLIYNEFVINESEILFNCIENNLFIIVNIDTNQIKKIRITPEMEDDIIKCIYWTDRTRIILESYKGNYYELLSHSGSIKKINIIEKKEINKEKASNDMVSFKDIYEHREYQHKNDPKYTECVGSVCVNGTFFYVFEYFILIKKKCIEERIIPKEKHIFTKIELIQNKTDYTAVVLSRYKSDRITDLIKYKINL